MVVLMGTSVFDRAQQMREAGLLDPTPEQLEEWRLEDGPQYEFVKTRSGVVTLLDIATLTRKASRWMESLLRDGVAVGTLRLRVEWVPEEAGPLVEISDADLLEKFQVWNGAWAEVGGVAPMSAETFEEMAVLLTEVRRRQVARANAGIPMVQKAVSLRGGVAWTDMEAPNGELDPSSNPQSQHGPGACGSDE